MGALPWLFQFLLYFAQYHLAFSSSSSSLSSFSSSPHPLCRHDQRSALLQFEQMFTIDSVASSFCYASYPKTTSWNESNATDCCNWDGVTCDGFTGHVIGLDLSCSQLHGTIHPNSSIFQLSHLQRLNLAFNNFSCSRISYEIGSFASLTHLNLSDSTFSGSIPSQISYLSKLISLDLSYSDLRLEPLHFKILLKNLTRLQELILGGVNISSALPYSVTNLTSLTALDLSSTGLRGNLPDNVFHLPNLQRLILYSNHLKGPLPFNLSGLQNLKGLNLHNNSLSGIISPWLFTLPSLEYLDLSSNLFAGQIPEFQHNLPLLHIDLGDNKLHGPIPQSIYTLVNLTILNLSSNDLSGGVDLQKLKNLERLDLSNTNLSLITTSGANNTFPNLKGIYMSSCNIEVFPDFLRTLEKLEMLDLSDNRIRGQIPNWVGFIGKASLSYLNLSHNFLIDIKHLPWEQLQILDLHSNLLQGQLPIPPPSILQFFISNNSLSGEIPSLICNASSIQILDLSYNKLSGAVPQCLGNFGSGGLLVLDLRSNGFKGTLPFVFSKENNLQSLNLNGNQFEGPLPRSLMNCTSLEVLNVGNNKINDTFPNWLGTLPELQVLVLRSNRFHGPINASMTKFPFPKLRIVDLSYNGFTGYLPNLYFEHFQAMKNSTMPDKQYMSDESDYYHDSLVVTMKEFEIEWVRISTIFAAIDFSSNNFSGEIPNVVGKLNSLNVLDFSHNCLTGHIPESLGDLTNLEFLDISSNLLQGQLPIPAPSIRYFSISNNNLSGEIPSLICNASSLQILDLSHNKLSGVVPQCLGNFGSGGLSVLDLGSNKFKGTLPFVFSKENNLQSLELNGNQFKGPLPRSLMNCTSLELLNVGNNKINDTFPNWLGTLPELRVLVLQSNQFHGPINASTTKFPFPKLQIVDLSYNGFTGYLPNLYFEHFQAMKNSTMPDKQHMSDKSDYYHDYLVVTMKEFDIEWVRISTIFTAIDFSSNNFSGKIPNAVGKLNSLKVLNFSHNCLTGHIPESLGDLTSLESLDISSNLLQGQLPIPAPSIRYFSISNNSLSGEIPSLICNASSLQILDLSHNKLSGVVPQCLGNFGSGGLSVLDLGSNKFKGTLPFVFSKENNLQSLELNGNQFKGPLPRSLMNCTSLEVLNVGNNKINDTFPNWLGTLPELQVLILRSNQFHGPINASTTKFPFPKLRIVDLSYNGLTGHLPNLYFEYFQAMKNISTMSDKQYMSDESSYYHDSLVITMKGSEIKWERILTTFTAIDFSSNNFSGGIPNVVGKLNSLKVLNFSHNCLMGHIPESLGDLTSLESLDISSNRLSGRIPSQLTSLTFLEVLNLSWNHLDGPIPHGPQFNTFDNGSYVGNPGLCGFPLPKDCEENQTKIQPPVLQQQEDDPYFDGYFWKIVVLGYGCGMTLGLFLGSLMFLIGRPKFFVRLAEKEVPKKVVRLRRMVTDTVGRRK